MSAGCAGWCFQDKQSEGAPCEPGADSRRQSNSVFPAYFM